MAPSESDMTLMSLPEDIKIEIVKHLPWKDVLDVRRIKCLAWATKEKSIWVNLVNDHIASELVPPRLERPMDNYTASELEHTFLRWKGAELAWKTADKHPRKEKQFRCGMAQVTHLVKGGRWYLTTVNKTAAVTYYDLDAKIIRGVELIPPQARCCRTGWNNLPVCLEVSTISSHLEFTMAFSIFDLGDKSSRAGFDHMYQAIHVWRVHCVLGGSGHVTGLAATKIATLPHRPSFYSIHKMSLCGSLIGLVVEDSKERDLFISVVDWERAQGQLLYPMRIIRLADASTCIYLLPNNRLLCQDDKDILLYDYSDIPETTKLPKNSINNYAVPVWTVKGREERHDIPPAIFCTAGTTRMLFTGTYTLHSLFFEDDSHKTPELVQVTTGCSNMWHRFRIALGFQRTVVFEEGTKTFSLITYTPTSQGPFTVKAFSVFRSSLMFLPEIDDFPMDEDTGRIVIHAASCQQAVVIDFSKYT